METMTREQMAIAVAKDVLKQLRRRKGGLSMRQGVYIGGGLPEGVEIDDEKDLREYADVVQANCQVCQLGALVLSKARLYDEVPAEVLGAYYALFGGHFYTHACGDALRDSLEDVFDRESICLMENAFEESLCMKAKWARESKRQAAMLFGAKFADPKSRTKAIMENVVANGGHFIP